MQSVQAFDFILFGGTGDLSRRKLVPALFYLHNARQLSDDFRVIATGRQHLSREDYLALLDERSRPHISETEFDLEKWLAFLKKVDYLPVDATDAADFARLGQTIGEAPERTRIFYLSTAPDLFAGICRGLNDANLVTGNSRVVLEKPLGRDRSSSDAINVAVAEAFGEDQIYRIDHYLGKETVQNLMALRFGNALFEPLWSTGKVRDVQITIAEQIGVEGRGEFYERTGALRDMVQNHLLQLLCIVAMEPPISIKPDRVRDEKLKVLQALHPFDPLEVQKNTVRGQYRAGAINGAPVPGYLEETGVAPDSNTETFVAIKARIDNWRWAGVPFYLRTGKRLQERVCEVIVNFHPVPHAIFPSTTSESKPNQLVIRLQPREGVELHLLAKQPGDENHLKPVKLDLDFAESFKTRQLFAYERLLMDVVRGNLTLFVRRDELQAAWDWIDPIVQAWQSSPDRPRHYTAGTWGPAAASALINRDHRSWPEEH